jgi:hypothetical protein
MTPRSMMAVTAVAWVVASATPARRGSSPTILTM